MSRLEGQVALVTGSSRGIGEAIVSELARRGAAVAVHGRDQAAVSDVATAIRQEGGQAIAVTGDATSFDHLEAVRHQIEESLGPVDILVANAGGSFTPPAPLEEIAEEGPRHPRRCRQRRRVPGIRRRCLDHWPDPRYHWRRGDGLTRRLLGRGCEDGRSPFQSLDIVAEPAVFAAQLRQLLPVCAGQRAVTAGLGIRPGPVGPPPDRYPSRFCSLRRRATPSVAVPVQRDDLGLQTPGGPMAALTVAPHAGAPATWRSGGDVAGRLRGDACPGHGGPGALVVYTATRRHPALPVRPAQLQRVGQEPHGVGARRPHPVGLKVSYGALAQPGARRQLLL